MRFPVILLLLLVFSATMATAQTNNAAGTWNATLTSPQGTFNIVLIVKQDGEKITGSTKGPTGDIPFEGTVKGKDLKLSYSLKWQDNDLLITLSGVLDGDTIRGNADYSGLANGDFNAKREIVAVAPDKIDISGAWAFQVESPAGNGTPTFTFKQEGEKLSGQYKGAFGEAPLTGTLKENKVEFTIKTEVQGTQLTITYTGTVEKDGTMKGKAELGDVGSATWTAKRK